MSIRVHQSDSEEDFESAPEDDGGEQQTPDDSIASKSEMTQKASNVQSDVTASDGQQETDRPTNEATGREMEGEARDEKHDEDESVETTKERKRQDECRANEKGDPSRAEMQMSTNTNTAEEKRRDSPCGEYEDGDRESRQTAGQLQKETEMKPTQNITDESASTEQPEKCEVPPPVTERFARDIKDALKAVTDTESKKPTSSGWGWGNWISSTASALGQGLQSAIHTVEETLGIPEPNDMARESETIEMEELVSKEVVENEPVKVEEAEADEVSELSNVEENKSSSGFSVWSGVSVLSSVIANKSSELMSGGIDALEAIGRKTMDVISEGDPGLRQKRAAIKELTSGPAVVLSKLLRDAKQQAEDSHKQDSKPGIHFSSLFDEYQGFVHLEALELLSNECSSKLQSAQVNIEDDDDVLKQLQLVKEAFELREETEEKVDVNSQSLKMASTVLDQLEKLKLPYKAQKLQKVEADIVKQLDDWHQEQVELPPPQAVFECGMRGLAQLTSGSIELFRKVSELILLPASDSSEVMPPAIDRSHTLNDMAVTITKGVSCVSAQFAEQLNACSESETASAKGESKVTDDVKSLVTSLYLEASNCTTYIQDAFQLLQPVLQLNSLGAH